jgi:hypothetical protein
VITIPVLVLEHGSYGEPWDTIGTLGDWSTSSTPKSV